MKFLLGAAILLASCSASLAQCTPPTGIEASIGELGGTFIRYEGARARSFIAHIALDLDAEDMPSADLVYLVMNPDSMDKTLIVGFDGGCMALAVTTLTANAKRAGWESVGV